MGGMREHEDWNVRVDPAVYSPWLGDSYANFARTGLSFQRSQNGGRNDPQPGPAYGYYKRLASQVTSGAKETNVFDGIDTSITGIVHGAEASGARERLDAAAARSSRKSRPRCRRSGWTIRQPPFRRWRAGLRPRASAVQQLAADPDAVQILKVKEQQFADAISTALGIDFVAVAQPAGLPEPTGPFAAFAAPPTMAPVIPGQAFDVKLRFTNRGSDGRDGCQRRRCRRPRRLRRRR